MKMFYIKHTLLLLGFIPLLTIAQSDSTEKKAQRRLMQFSNSKNAIKFNILSPFYSNLCLGTQHMLNEEKSFNLVASYMDFSGVFGGNDNGSGTSTANHKTIMYSVAPEFRFNLSGRYLSGIYFSTFMRYMYMDYTYDNITYPGNIKTFTPVSRQHNTLGIGVLFGSQTIFKRKIVIDAFVGPVYTILMKSNYPVTKNSDIEVQDGIPNLLIRGYGIRSGLFIGLAY